MSGKRPRYGAPVDLPLGNDEEQPQEEEESENDVESDDIYSSSDGDQDEDEDRTVVVNVSELREDLSCPICLGIIRKTKAVMECMHRFCGECIEKSIRFCKNECPVCLEHHPGGCTLRDDHNFDSLIALLYPHPDIEEESLQREAEALDRKRRAKKTAAAFAKRRRMIGNAGKQLPCGAEKTEAGPSKSGETQVLQESATLHADETGDENIPDVNTE